MKNPGYMLHLLGCGILRKEVLSLIEKNRWPLIPGFLDAGMHCEIEKLMTTIMADVAAHRVHEVIVFYGCCHPLMDKRLDEIGALRTEGENCLSMLLGEQRYLEERLNGAYFVLEEWACDWEHFITSCFESTNMDVIREIFRLDLKYLLCIRTPFSGDYTAAAEEVARNVALPLRWMDVGLENLESVLQAAITRKLTELQWTTSET